MIPRPTVAEALERLRSRPVRVVDIIPAVRVVRDERVMEAVPLLIGYLRDTDQLVVWDACVALGLLGAREAIPDLLDLLRPEAAAERGIICIPDPFGWYEESPQEGAIQGLKLLKATEAVPVLVGLLNTAHEITRAAVVDALMTLGASEEAPRIAPLIVDESSRVRRAAYAFLDSCWPSDVVRALREAAEGDPSNGNLRDAVEKTVAEIRARMAGQLSPAADDAGRLSLGTDAAGTVSLADADDPLDP